LLLSPLLILKSPKPLLFVEVEDPGCILKKAGHPAADLGFLLNTPH
jgi:hypothetical protein